MILGAEIALVIYGIYVLIKGSFNLGKGRIVTGSKARILALLCLAPLPVSFCAGAVIGLALAASGQNVENFLLYTAVELVILIVVIAVIMVLGRDFYNQQSQSPHDLE